MAANRRRFEIGDDTADVVSPEVEKQLVVAAVEQAETEAAIEASASEPAVPLSGGLPVCWLWAQGEAWLRKPDGVSESVSQGTLLPAYTWVPVEPGVVAVNLGERGKWWIQQGQWVVYYRG